MSGSFFGLNIAKSGLFASQRALQVIGHNIANANTPGYSRQRVEMSQSDPMALSGGQGMIGTGVDTLHIKNIRDEFLDIKYRDENQAFGEWNTRADVLKNIEAIFGEPSDSAIRKAMDDYFVSLEKLSTDAENLTTRATVRESGIKLAKMVNQLGYQLEKVQRDLDFNVKTTVDQINGYADQIAELNDQICRYELDGSRANDLRDERNLILDQLSELVKIDTFEEKSGKIRVMADGNQLVSQTGSSHLKIKEREPGEKKNNADVEQLSDVVWEKGGSFIPKGGKLKGYIDARDNISGDEKGVPYYTDQLNNFAKTFVVQTNLIHREGYGLNGQHGVDFFQMNGEIKEITKDKKFMNLMDKYGEQEAIRMIEGAKSSELGKEPFEFTQDTIPSYNEMSVVKIVEDGTEKYYITSKITATSMSISDAVEKELNAIAASSTHAGLPGSGDNALKMNQIKDKAKMYAWGKPEDFMKSLISNLGVDSQHAKNTSKNQAILLGQTDNKKQSISGVSLDEEMANMIKFQHAYQANARMITAIDQMIDTIINRMGLVGR
ncbi:flagellar hook-associated protein FlgK [Crassaminicella profunda]|uniref:flagellar hook-associated protein FlgK n=1 Tax=Crassaminicella profunda TaxID=1286698 RepID=UPI001CA67A82|nr:flagellar hook-associated protein FlgK [Crassaminicella profunda]QZY54320.1 flagellar hook-associated protein FlgK [Crassaminicella profunda]